MFSSPLIQLLQYYHHPPMTHTQQDQYQWVSSIRHITHSVYTHCQKPDALLSSIVYISIIILVVVLFSDGTFFFIIIYRVFLGDYLLVGLLIIIIYRIDQIWIDWWYFYWIYYLYWFQKIVKSYYYLYWYYVDYLIKIQ